MMSLDEMLSMERPRSLQHPPMPRSQRAAQFSAFDALCGFREKLRHMEQCVTDHDKEPY